MPEQFCFHIDLSDVYIGDSKKSIILSSNEISDCNKEQKIIVFSYIILFLSCYLLEKDLFFSTELVPGLRVMTKCFDALF